MFDDLRVLDPKYLNYNDAALTGSRRHVNVKENEVSFCGGTKDLPLRLGEPPNQAFEKCDCRLSVSPSNIGAMLNKIWRRILFKCVLWIEPLKRHLVELQNHFFRAL